ncbi:MAG: SDR family NAD(P)-dependent oxidoreductase [Gammaproteobacteria bacterium AqS3]|nr:SDR family NAD(P)-dependent oxidoreductase [Gammaproteobacteria bacterium AqS3]
MDIEGRTAVVTGAASGIGLAIAGELIKRQCRVVIADWDGDGARKAAEALGENADAVRFDAADTASVEAMAEEVWRLTGGVDLIFANAGVSAGAPLLQAEAEALDWHINVNVRGVWATGKAFINRIIAEGRSGHFTITASEHSLGLQHAGAGFYTASKHAVLGLAEVLRAELPETVGISVFCPGLVETRLHDAGRFGVLPPAPEEMQAFAAAVMSRGMAPEAVAQAAVNGTANGDFYIVTHPSAFAAAEKRFAEISQAFDDQAPMTEDARRYEVNAVIAELLSDPS